MNINNYYIYIYNIIDSYKFYDIINVFSFNTRSFKVYFYCFPHLYNYMPFIFVSLYVLCFPWL